MRGRNRQFFEPRAAARVGRGGVQQCQEKEVELLSNEAERDDRHAGAHPSEKRLLVRGVIGIAFNHQNASLSGAAFKTA
jgi:hypothetical protein